MPSHRLACAPPIPHPANFRRSAIGNRVRTAEKSLPEEISRPAAANSSAGNLPKGGSPPNAVRSNAAAP